VMRITRRTIPGCRQSGSCALQYGIVGDVEFPVGAQAFRLAVLQIPIRNREKILNLLA